MLYGIHMKSNKKRTTISISSAIYANAVELMKLRRFADFTAFIEQLIREDWDKRIGPAKGSPPLLGLKRVPEEQTPTDNGSD